MMLRSFRGCLEPGISFVPLPCVETRDLWQPRAGRSGPLILSDYTLPGFNGLAALKIAQEERPDLPFIFLSGTLGEDQAMDSLKSGATDYVLKKHLSASGSGGPCHGGSPRTN